MNRPYWAGKGRKEVESYRRGMIRTETDQVHRERDRNHNRWLRYVAGAKFPIIFYEKKEVKNEEFSVDVRHYVDMVLDGDGV